MAGGRVERDRFFRPACRTRVSHLVEDYKRRVYMRCIAEPPAVRASPRARPARGSPGDPHEAKDGGWRPCAAGPRRLPSWGMDPRDPELKKGLDATLQARRELGEECDSALVDSFLEKAGERLGATMDRRVRRELAERQLVVARGASQPRAHNGFDERYGFGIASLVL
ncbi:hypothetical protein GCM10023082_22610 [Streptomyces tremellae]|uniref:Uncharacterized protein n=1 Tax=Streptomyces tremellae TaxID=1124239 RepID=A0ABP7EUI5_9ACTN